MKLAHTRWIQSTTCLVTCAVLIATAVRVVNAADESPPVPDGARIALVFSNGTQFVLGDVIDLTFVLSNAGPGSFKYATGGDYRGTGFPTRYKFTVLDENGTALPKESWMEMGGMFGWHELKRGDVHEQPLRLQNYVRVNRPGVFTVRVVHDFGWKPTEQKPTPVAEAKIAISAPNPDQAEKHVNAIEHNREGLRDYELGSQWIKTEFRYLNHPAFLPALEKRAAAGEVRAFEGIQRIETQDATRALMRLLTNDTPDVRHAAAMFLARRMPPRVVNGYPRRPFWSPTAEEADAYVKLWLPEATGPLRAAADQLLYSTNVSYMRTGAFIIEAIGKDEDAGAVLTALKTTLHEWKSREKPEDNVLNTPGAGDALIAALAGLRERGYRAPQNGGIEVIMARLLELDDPKVPRSDGWEQLLGAFFTQNPPMLREAAVRALPKPPTGKWEKLLLGALEDHDRGVMRQACKVAGESENPAFAKPLANIVRTERQKWVVHEASEALTKLGAHWAATDAWIERIVDEDLWYESMTFLVGKLEHPKSGGSSGNRPSREGRIAMREKWQQFFSEKKRQAMVQAGTPVPVTEDETRELLGDAYRIGLADGKDWPAKR
jgi:hypothetical protein